MYLAQLDKTPDIKGSNNAPFFQPKLTINQPNDPDSYRDEQEADAMADKIMRMTDPSVNNNAFFKPSFSSIQRKCGHCEEAEKKVQRKESNNESAIASNQTEDYINSLSGGKPLGKNERNFFEPRMNYDFSGVRLHTDSVAARSAQSINALAYTTGNNIVFNSGQYFPGTDNGKRLLGHELTHVIQQQNNNIGAVQRMAACPARLNDSDPTPPGWKDYFGASSVFHCGFRTILEDRMPIPDDPMNECVYDHSGRLVTEYHPYSGCRGTPDQYDSKSSPIRHAIIDSGGIVRAGAPALGSSVLHAIGSPFQEAYNWLDRGIRNIYRLP